MLARDEAASRLARTNLTGCICRARPRRPAHPRHLPVQARAWGATTNKTNNATFSREQLLIIVRLLKCNTLLPHDPTTDGHAHPMCCAPSARFQGERAPRVGPGFHRLVRGEDM